MARPRTTSPSTRTPRKKPEPPAGSEPSAGSSAPSEPGGLGLVGQPFERTGDEPQPARIASDLEAERYEPPPPEPFEWDPQKAESVVRIGGLVLHTVDPLGNSPFGADLWKATEEDCEAIAPPLSRILNRYAVARQLAGYSDEAELAAAVWAYGKKNMATRGRVVAMHQRRDEDENAAHRSAYVREEQASADRLAPPEPAVIPTASPPPEPSPADATPLHLAESTLEIVGEVSGDFDGVAGAGVTGDDLGMFGTPQGIGVRGRGLMPDLEPTQYE